MRLHLSLPTAIATKLRQLSLQDLRPIELQAEYMLCRAVKRAQLKPEATREPTTREVTHAPAQ